jgi:hypothetical protein
LAWLRSRQRANAHRPTFRVAPEDALRARQGGPPRFAAPAAPDDRVLTGDPSSEIRLVGA